MSKTTYKQAGVDVEAGDRLKSRLGELVRATHGPAVLSDMSGFSSLYAMPEGFSEPVLVASTDGVGTKVIVAAALGRLEGVGQDLVAMCVNDLVTCGARPLFFLDYIAVERFDAAQIETLIASVADACRRAGMALVGGETAQMPGVYAPGRFDLAGFCVGVVERSAILGRERVAPGDVLLGVPSSGLHSNGYSLVRAVFGDHPGDDARELVEPTRLYPAAVQAALAVGEVHAIAHITGGGLPGNVVRILPDGLRAVLDSDRWQVPAIFGRLAERGGVERDEMFRTFNMGIGLVLAVAPTSAKSILKAAESEPELAGMVALGEVEEGENDVEIR
ncbi:MAG: phosphoribosylformylglycinamidine cyclo-ligase [bacterium]|nr:phosphoribosylformylglycinamidine cyclo-ligase [bacterium]